MRDRLADAHDTVAASTVGKHEMDGPPRVLQLVEAVGSKRVESLHPSRFLLSSSCGVGGALEGGEEKVLEAAITCKMVRNRGRVML